MLGCNLSFYFTSLDGGSVGPFTVTVTAIPKFQCFRQAERGVRVHRSCLLLWLRRRAVEIPQYVRLTLN